MILESQDHDSLRSFLSLYKLPFRLHKLFNFFKNNDCTLDSMISSNKTNVSTHFSSLNSIFLCTLMEMYSQGKYTITLKKMEMYNLTSTVSPLSSLSLSLSNFEWYIKIPQIEDNIQSYQWNTHCKDYFLR